MSKQYKFQSRSALSFAVNAHGRQTYVNFSPAYRGLSFFITSDEVLAGKIRSHRWFREGRITETVEDILPASEERPYVQPPVPERKTYSILGKPMASPKPKQATKSPADIEIPGVPPVVEKKENSQVPAFVADDVASFMEAKEFFITNFGVQRSEVSTKDAVSALCKRFNVTFPNYPL